MVYKLKQIYKLLFIAMLSGTILLQSHEANAASPTIFEYEYRYTFDAIASDYAQCEAIVAPFQAITWSMVFVLMSIWYVSPCMVTAMAAVPVGWTAVGICISMYVWPHLLLSTATLSMMAGGLYVVTAYILSAVITNFIREDARIANTSDSGCSWPNCYNPATDHTIDPDESEIFNKIGLQSDEYGSVGFIGGATFIKPYDCQLVTFKSAVYAPVPYQVCAFEEGSELCSEIVFCSGVVQQLLREMQVFAAMIGLDASAVNGVAKELTFDKISGRARNAYIAAADGRRTCGSDPWSGDAQDDANPSTKDGNRCECTCCSNSGYDDGYEDICCPPDSLDTSSCVNPANLACKTYNERYHYHCVSKVFAEEDMVPPVAMPSTMSSYCDPGNEMGYTPFSFAGRVMRCLEGTITNSFFGFMDVVSYDAVTGKPERDPDIGSYIFVKTCQDGTAIPSDGYCDASFLIKVQSYLQNLVFLVLSLYVTFIGIGVLTGAGFAKKELFIAMMKIGIIAYFCFGEGWRDGYYKALMTGSYEVAAEFFDALEGYDVDTDLVFTPLSSSTVINGSSAGCVLESGSNYEEVIDNLEGCDFFDGIQYSGVPYTTDDNHFAVWDSLDCRFANYTGFTTNGFYPNIVALAFAAVFTSSTGLMFLAVSVVLLFAIFTIFANAIFVGVVAMLYVSILIFISPLTILCYLFKPTKGIFDVWLKQLIGYSMQPAVLFAFLAVMIKMLDLFFAQYMAEVVNIQISTYSVIGLDIPYVKSKTVTFSYFVGNLLRFTFLVLILQQIFEKLDELMKGLTGADGSSGAMPNVGDAMKKGMGAAYGGAKNIAGNAKRQAGKVKRAGAEAMASKKPK